jgi:hypothetical protein
VNANRSIAIGTAKQCRLSSTNCVQLALATVAHHLEGDGQLNGQATRRHTTLCSAKILFSGSTFFPILILSFIEGGTDVGR